ncbi:MAG: ATPase, T2SS/T4P/T4SS family [Kiritimatiellae bacterium]|jgi:type IV pilus assembly protein PilB|nr:ATPase, T2SS/T4P/T4SS family [Kiritimatiellia bacterium]
MSLINKKDSFESILLKRGVLTEEQLKRSLNNSSHLPLEKHLSQNPVINKAKLTLAMADYFNTHPITLPETLVLPQELLELAPLRLWKKLKAAPLMKLEKVLTVAFGDPFDLLAQEDISQVVKMKIIPLIALETEVLAALVRSDDKDDGAMGIEMESIMHSPDADVEVTNVDEKKDDNLDKTLETAGEAPVIRMVNMMLVEALRTNASDIHFEAMEKTSRLRYRIDGALIERPSPPRTLHNAIVSRIKIMSELDIAERRVPQDGRFKIKALKKEVDIRVSILPTVHGEKVVMRTLDKSNLAPSLAALGLDAFAYKAMRYAIDQPHGIILVTGPTGSGKTTTLYSCLQDLNKPDVNIVTAEDPVEYQLHGVNQVHVNPQTGLTFASVLRSVLRQDPDIVLVGEIRDGETADIAVKAALTGHLVLSTLHTNDAAGVIARLIDMGVPPFLMASSLILAQAQRLYRKLCPICKKPSEPDPKVLIANHINPKIFEGKLIYSPAGCVKCNNIGYKGRGAIMEVLPISEKIREAVIRGMTTSEIHKIAIQEGMVSLKDAGLLKVADGITSIQAAIEVTGGG